MVEINEVDIYAPQDPSVGLFSVFFTINLQGLETDDIEFVRAQLERCFSEIYDDKVKITFDFERQAA